MSAKLDCASDRIGHYLDKILHCSRSGQPRERHVRFSGAQADAMWNRRAEPAPDAAESGWYGDPASLISCHAAIDRLAALAAPAQAMQPMSEEKIGEGLKEAGSPMSTIQGIADDHFRQGVRFAEASHRIGTPDPTSGASGQGSA